MRSTPGPAPAGFADSIDYAALGEVTAAVAGIDEHELVGVISRPDGGFRWDPHSAFARVGVPPIEFARADLAIIAQPGPTSTRPPAYSLILRPLQELTFRLVVDLDLP